MLTINEHNHKELLHPSSLEEILEILSLEYGEDLRPFSKAPHQWLLMKDEERGVIGGVCLTPCDFLPSSLMLAEFCLNLKRTKGWVASHSFLWIPEGMEEGSKEESKAISAFYAQLYTKFVDFCSAIGIEQVWMISLVEHHLAASTIGLLPFSKELPFNHQGRGYVAALLPASRQLQATLQQSHAVYSTTQCRIN